MAMQTTEPVERFTAAFGIAHGALIWLLGGRRLGAAAMIAADLVVAALIVQASPRLRRADPAALRFLGIALPLLAFGVFYLQTGFVDVSSVHWHDAELATLQRYVLDRVPFIHAAPVRDWFILAYFSYDVFLVAGVLALLAPGDATSERSAGDAVRRICYALAGCYVIGLLFPALSPRYIDPQLQLAYLDQGTAVGRIAASLQNRGMVPGSSFPSAHLAAVTTLMWDLHRARRVLFWLCLPLAVSMAAGTVLFLYHYIPDVASGIFVGAVAVGVDRRSGAPAPDRATA